MSKFDPPAPRYDPATLTPPPGHQQGFQGIETPPLPQDYEQTHPEGVANHSNPHATVKKCNVASLIVVGLRGASLLFTFLSFVIIATTRKFAHDNSFNYVFVVGFISFIYNIYQNVKGAYELVSKKQLISHKKASALSDFIGDQVITYMLMSGSSVGFSLADQYQGYDNEVYSKTAGSAAMLFFAFLTLVFPTFFSALNLFNASACSNANVPPTA